MIEDVLARGVIGDEADGGRVRGAVGLLLVPWSQNEVLRFKRIV